MKNSSNYKYYTSACGPSHGNFLLPLGFEHTNNIEEADVILFGGGADVDPETYGEKPSSTTWCSKNKEKVEKDDFQIARKLDKKCIGICRGHQLLNALAGGKLIQDVSSHGGHDHTITTFDGFNIRVNSLHHQMINPYVIKNKDNYRILAWSSKRISKRYLGAKDKPVYLPWGFKEIEAVWFPKIKSIGFQYHPEMMFGHKEQEAGVAWTQKTFLKFFNDQL